MSAGNPSQKDFEVEELPAIVCSDRFYMTDDAMNILNSAGSVTWADCENEDDLVKIGAKGEL